MTKPKNANSLRRNILWILVPAIIAGFAGFWWQGGVKMAVPAAADSRKLIESKESIYNNIYVYSEGSYVTMTFGFNRRIYTESAYNPLDELELPVTYTRYMTASLIYPGEIKSILEIGFGGGRTAWYMHRFFPDALITSVELDPEIVNLAHKYFGIKDEPNFKVANEDGRLFLSNSKNKYDIIMIDAYRGPFVPFHLLTKEFYQLVHDHLAPGGVVVQNVEPSTMLFNSAVKTIQSVFPHLDFYVMGGNVVTIAYDGPEKGSDELARIAAERQKAFSLRYNLSELLAHRQPFVPGAEGPVDPSAKILTDDFAPVETLKAVAAHNRKWAEQ